MSGGLESSQIKNIHNNPLALIRTDKESELADLLVKDERFRGMMEVYAIFRELIAQERVARDRTVRMGTVSDQLVAMQNKLNYVD
jgi:hypothetical protein